MEEYLDNNYCEDQNSVARILKGLAGYYCENEHINMAKIHGCHTVL